MERSECENFWKPNARGAKELGSESESKPNAEKLGN